MQVVILMKKNKGLGRSIKTKSGEDVYPIQFWLSSVQKSAVADSGLSEKQIVLTWLIGNKFLTVEDLLPVPKKKGSR